MNAERMLRAADRLQQRQRWLSFPIAAWKKFSDDQAGNLAALIAYYAFAAIFPLLLVLITVLDITLSSNPGLRERLLTSALAQYPMIGPRLRENVHALGETGLALAIGLLFTFFGARGIANAIQNAFNTVWEVPFPSRPRFPWSLLRSIALILVVGIGEIITVTLSGFAGGAAHLIPGIGPHIAAIGVSLLLNLGLFWLAFRLATSKMIATRDLRLGAFTAAVAWQILQLAAGYVVAHYLNHSRELYGTFGLVLGLLAWLYLQAQITLYAVELNVVWVRKLWPRSLFPPPYTQQDLAAYELYAKAEQRRPELGIEIREPGQDGASLAAKAEPKQDHLPDREPGPNGASLAARRVEPSEHHPPDRVP